MNLRIRDTLGTLKLSFFDATYVSIHSTLKLNGSSLPCRFSSPQRQPFSTPARSLLKTMTMTTGEFEYDGIFRQAPGGIDAAMMVREIPFPPVTYILWIVFIILMPILLTNLLVCNQQSLYGIM